MAENRDLQQKRGFTHKHVHFIRTLINLLNNSKEDSIHYSKVIEACHRDYKCRVTDYSILSLIGLIRNEKGYLSDNPLTLSFIEDTYDIPKYIITQSPGNRIIAQSKERVYISDLLDEGKKTAKDHKTITPNDIEYETGGLVPRK